MAVNNETPPPRSRVKKGSNRVLYLFIVVIVVLTGGFYFYQRNIVSLRHTSNSYESTAAIQNSATDTSSPLTPTQPLSDSDYSDSQHDSFFAAVTPHSNKTVAEQGVTPLTEPTEGVTNNGAIEDTDMLKRQTSFAKNPEKSHYKALTNRLDAFYSHLDAQQYIKDFKLPKPSKEYFSGLIQKLIDNPPVVTSETDDLFTLLKNTAHFFRIIGKHNVVILKGILDRERTSFETILQTFYQLTEKPKYLKSNYSISLNPDALYDYAGFFLNTMGGRLYLFRRDSSSRMAVSYYAILIIDRANDSGNSRNGIDIRPAINSLIEEIENGGNNLQLRDTYLDTLYDLKEKYN